MSASAAATIQALVLRKPSEPAQIESLPRPVLTEANDLLLEIHAAATNPVDLKHKYWKHSDDPIAAGMDAAGVVVQVGTSAAAQRFKVGDEVFYSGALGRSGNFAELALVDSRLVALKPKSLSFIEAAAFPLVSVTAHEVLHDLIRVKASKTIFIVGGAGGVGSIAIQLAKQAGLKVIASASRDETRAWVKKMGADFVVDHTKDLAAEFKANDLAPADYIFNTFSEKLTGALLPVVAPFGHIVGINGDAEIPADVVRGLFFKRVQFGLEFMASRTIHGVDIEKHGNILAEIARGIDAGQLKPIHNPHIYQGFKGAEEAEVVQCSGKAIGKLVIQIKQ